MIGSISWVASLLRIINEKQLWERYNILIPKLTLHNRLFKLGWKVSSESSHTPRYLKLSTLCSGEPSLQFIAQKPRLNFSFCLVASLLQDSHFWTEVKSDWREDWICGISGWDVYMMVSSALSWTRHLDFMGDYLHRLRIKVVWVLTPEGHHIVE